MMPTVEFAIQQYNRTMCSNVGATESRRRLVRRGVCPLTSMLAVAALQIRVSSSTASCIAGSALPTAMRVSSAQQLSVATGAAYNKPWKAKFKTRGSSGRTAEVGTDAAAAKVSVFDTEPLRDHVEGAKQAIPRNNDRRYLPLDVKPYIISPQVRCRGVLRCTVLRGRECGWRDRSVRKPV